MTAKRRRPTPAPVADGARSAQAPGQAPGLIIKIDTRESDRHGPEAGAYDFSDLGIRTVRGKLDAADYSVVGAETRMGCERKTVADLHGTIFAGRARFLRELARLSTYDFAAIVIEGSLHDVMTYEPPRAAARFTPAQRAARPKIIVHSLLSWWTKYRVAPIFAGNRDAARRIVARLCESYWRIQHPRTKGKREPNWRSAAGMVATASRDRIMALEVKNAQLAGRIAELEGMTAMGGDGAAAMMEKFMGLGPTEAA